MSGSDVLVVDDSHVISSLLDYSVGLGLDRIHDMGRRKLLLGLSIVANLTILGFFKYYDFFIESLATVLKDLSIPFQVRTLGVILPVGISFYTFQTMSYAIDVYRAEMKATRNFIQFLAYVSFFPQLVAGPIERAKHLLPQFAQPRRITRPMIEEGLWLCLWGMFKKVVIADNLAPLVEMVYGHSQPGGLMVVLATIAFGLQIYSDFSGYSDIARGTARLLGFDIMLNFNVPYLAQSTREFWRRWHISFSTWLRDYLYIPLGGSRRGAFRTYLNLFMTMLLGGLWHGAAWNFVGWGAWHGLGLAVQRIWTRRQTITSTDRHPLANASGEPPSLPTAADALRDSRSIEIAVEPSMGRSTVRIPTRHGVKLNIGCWLLTMAFIFYGWLLFRAGSWHQIIVLTTALSDLTTPPWTRSYVCYLVLFALPLLFMKIWLYRANDLLAPLELRWVGRTTLQGMLLLGIILFWEKDKVPFIYFQF